MIHELKTLQPYFNELKAGNKTFELRKDDRGFKVGDFVLLKEYNAETKTYLGGELKFKITYILDLEKFNLTNSSGDKYVILGIQCRD
jgi:ASC-1-like (ASCH) protein